MRGLWVGRGSGVGQVWVKGECKVGAGRRVVWGQEGKCECGVVGGEGEEEGRERRNGGSGEGV